jgi:hypothetical protein
MTATHGVAVERPGQGVLTVQVGAASGSGDGDDVGVRALAIVCDWEADAQHATPSWERERPAEVETANVGLGILAVAECPPFPGGSRKNAAGLSPYLSG